MGDTFFGITDRGKVRSNNEDNFLAQTVFKKKYLLACVIDGVGGYAGGDLAASITRETILQKLNDQPAHITNGMIAALELANQKIFKAKELSREHDKMACVATLAIADLAGNKFYYAHVGDTRLYLFRDQSLVKITNDHSAVGFLEESGRITEAAAMAHPKRNEVNKALGYELNPALEKDFIDSGESPFLPGDTLLLCSDGLTDMVATASIIAILNEPGSLAEKGKKMIDAANEAGGKDNITVVLVYNNNVPLQHPATRPAMVAQKIPGIQQQQPTANNQQTEEPVNLPVENEIIRRKKSPVGLLMIGCLLLLAGFLYYFIKDLQQNAQPKILMPAPVKKSRNGVEQLLLNSLQKDTASSLLRIRLTQPLIITDTILIKNDSLLISGNGFSIKSDSSFTGPAFVLAPTVKYIMLDSLLFENFGTCVFVMKQGLHLRKVKFVNCTTPIVFQFPVASQKAVSGSQASIIFNINDTL